MRHDITATKLRPLSTEKALKNEPIEKMLPNEPIEPMEKLEPIEPIEKADLYEPIDHVESIEAMLRGLVFDVISISLPIRWGNGERRQPGRLFPQG